MKHIKFALFIFILFVLSFAGRLYLNYGQYGFSNWKDSLFFSFWTSVGLYLFFLGETLVDKLSEDHTDKENQ